MNFKRLLKAAFKIKNIALLGFVIVFSILIDFLPFLLVGMAGYIFFVLQTLRSDEFKKEILQAETIARIEKLNIKCTRLYVESRRIVGRTVDSKIKLVLGEKEDLMREFLGGRDGILKQKITEQALKLIKAYIKLSINFSARCNELIEIDVNKIRDRINANHRKLGFIKDSNTLSDIRKVIAMDQRMLERIEAEKGELERVSAKLDYMESTVRMFKHRLLTSDYDDAMFSDVENVVNEATALDNVLNDNRNNRLKA